MTFDMPVESKILIYGAGSFGKEIYKKAKEAYSVVCFVDKNKNKIEDIDVEVRTLKDIVEYKESIVVVCVHNGSWHREIAEQLQALGFNKILFLALFNVYQSEKAALMNQFYNLFLEGQYDLLRRIPCYSDMLKNIFEEKVIRKNSAYVITYCGKELLYSQEPVQGVFVEEFYSDAPMVAVKLYMDLFRYFMYGEGSPAQYIKTMKNINNSFSMSDEEFLEDQYSVYKMLENNYWNGGVDSMPIDVKWNQRGYFNIMDGHHRSAFYILKGMQKLPVRMRKKEYDIWRNDLALKRTKALLNKTQLIPAVRICHPMLMDHDCRYNEYEITVLDVLQMWLYTLKRKFESVLELSPYQSYLGQNFYKMRKADKITSVVRSMEEAELARELCALQYIPEEAVEIVNALNVAEMIEKGCYELGLLCNFYDLEELQLKLCILNDCIEDILFWQSRYDAEAEKKYILDNSKFCKYQYLATKCMEGRFYEIGVFRK